MRNSTRERRRALSATGMALAAAIALAGCVGIPMSGRVSTGDVISDEADLSIAYSPSGPRAGAEQEEILLGFIQAATSPKEDFAIARQFLASTIAEEWKPNAVTQVRTATASTRRETDTVLNYTITTSARVDATGRYFEEAPATQVLEFGFEQDAKGEWRINSAPDGIVLTEESLATIFSASPLYFFDPTYRFLIPDVRWFPRTTLLSTRVVAALLDGPASWLQQGVVFSDFPTGTTLVSRVEISAATATVELSEEALAANPQRRERMRQQLVRSLGVPTVVMNVNGLAMDVPDSGSTSAEVNPTVATSLLVRTEDAFGFLTSDDAVSPIKRVSDAVVQFGATAVTLGRDGSAAALLTGSGVYVARESEAALLVDTRGGLVAPSIDAEGFVWSAPSSNAAAIRVFEFNGTVHDIESSLPAGSRLVSMSLSRDGARVLLSLVTDTGPRLVIAGVRRQDSVPIGLGELVDLATSKATPLGAAWIDDSSVAALTSDGSGAAVTLYAIGGPSSSIGRVRGGVAIVGGNGGTDGLRVINADGEVFRPRGNGWQDTGVVVSFLATQQ